MTTWRHPTLGEIAPIPTKLFPKKVWRHFYDPGERWRSLCGADVEGMRSEVEVLVGVSRGKVFELPKVDRERWERAKPLFARHHADAYAPCYMGEIASPEARWTEQMDARFRHCALTPKSVFAVVQLDKFLSWVVTAYRPLPRCRGVEMDEGEIRRHAENYFLRKTGVNIEDITTGVIAELKRCDSAPSDSKTLWWLASAVGQGRLLRAREDVREALASAEGLLAEVPSELVHELAARLEWLELEDELATSLKEDRPEDFEAWLIDAESILAVADALGSDDAARGFVEQAERLMPWVPNEWGHLLEVARFRCAYFDSASNVLRLWAAVEEALVSAVMRSEAPTVRPVTRLVDALIPDEGESLWSRVRDYGRRVGRPLKGVVDAVTQELWVAPPVPVMGGASSEAVAEVVGVEIAPLEHVRVFVLDEDHPDGVEVTEQAKSSERVPSERVLWQFERESERALVVLVAGEQPLGGGDLTALVDEAERREDMVIGTREFQPSQATNAKR